MRVSHFIFTATLMIGSGVAVAAASAQDIPAGAAACSGCHPLGRTVATAVPKLAGRNAAEVVAAMQAFRAGQRQGTVMDRIAKGFSDDEVRAIAAWYAAQRE